MTDNKDETSKPADPASAAAKPADPKPADPKRPHATIELKATEIKSAAASTAASAAKPADPKAGEGKPADPKAATAAAAPGKPQDGAKPGDGKAATDKPVVPVAARAPSRAGALVTNLVSGLAGGALAWYAATVLGPQYGLLPKPDDARTVALEAKLTALEKAAASTKAVTPDILTKLADAQAQITKLEASAKTVSDLATEQVKLAADQKTLTDQLAKDGPAARINRLEEQLKLMTEAAAGDPQAGKLPQVAALSGRLVDLENTLTNQLSALRKTVSQELEQRLALTNESSEAAKSGTNRLDRDLSSVKADAAATVQKLDKLRADADRLVAAVQGIRDQGNELKTALEGAKSEIEAKFKAAAKPAEVAAAIAPVAAKLGALEANVQAVVKAEDERRLSAERILLSLELGNLKRVVDRGQKYAAELAEVKKAATGLKTDLTVLERYKDNGIATLADLQRDFATVSTAIIESEIDKGDGSIMGRMLASARAVVNVRKINYPANDKSAEAVAGRIEAALRDGNLAVVLDEAKNIPANAAPAAQEWLVKVEARGAVDRAIAGLETSLKTSLTGPAPAANQPKF